MNVKHDKSILDYIFRKLRQADLRLPGQETQITDALTYSQKAKYISQFSRHDLLALRRVGYKITLELEQLLIDKYNLSLSKYEMTRAGRILHEQELPRCYREVYRRGEADRDRQHNPIRKKSKKHSKEQIKLLAEHIEQVGFDTPIVVDENLVIIKGHGRLEALKYLKQSKALVKIVTGLSEAQKRAARIADNKLQELATDHDEFLRVELQELHQLDVDIKSLGFDDVRITELKVDLLDPSEKKARDEQEEIEDEIPEIEENIYGVKQGDLWLLGAYLQCDQCGVKVDYDKSRVDQICGSCNA